VFAGQALLISPSSKQNEAGYGLPQFIASAISQAGLPHVTLG